MPPSEGQPKTAIEHFDTAAQSYEKYTGGCSRELARLILNLPELADAGLPGSAVLDNACGTGIVAEEIVQRQRRGGFEAEATGGSVNVFLADPAPNMVMVAGKKLEAMVQCSSPRFHLKSGVMPGEQLSLDDNVFTHSITNLGILFYVDGAAGARELYRTLRLGGVAVVTSWSDLGYLDPIIRPAQLSIRPTEQPYQLPINPQWLSPAYLQHCLEEDGGFSHVNVIEERVHYGAATVEETGDLLTDSFKVVWKDWSDEEKARFRALVIEKTGAVAEQYEMPNGQTGFGVPMRASVAVCKK